MCSERHLEGRRICVLGIAQWKCPQAAKIAPGTRYQNNTFSAKAGAIAHESAREYTDARVQALEGMVERLIDHMSFLESQEQERELQEAQHDVDSQVTQMYDSSDESSPDSPESVLVGLTENLLVDDAMQL